MHQRSVVHNTLQADFDHDPTQAFAYPLRFHLTSFTRNFLFTAQGEDVVSGRRSAHRSDELAAVLPAVWQTLRSAGLQLERATGDMQDFEFTVQDGQLFML